MVSNLDVIYIFFRTYCSGAASITNYCVIIQKDDLSFCVTSTSSDIPATLSRATRKRKAVENTEAGRPTVLAGPKVENREYLLPCSYFYQRVNDDLPNLNRLCKILFFIS